MTAGRSLSLMHTLPAWLGGALGLAVSLQPVLVVLGIAAACVALMGLVYPSSLVGLMFLAVLFDRLGVTGMNVAQFPITASKLSVLGGLALWGVRVVLRGGTLLRWHAALWAMSGVVVMTAFSVAFHDCMHAGKYTLFGLGMMTVLVAFVYTVLAEAPLGGLFRFLAAALIGVCLLSLLPSSGGRASGTLGDPNEWGTMVLLLTPTILGGLAGDRHALARPLRIVLFLLFPLVVMRTGSRSAFVVGVVILPCCVYLLRRRRGELAAGITLAAIAAPFAIGLSATLERLRGLVGNLSGSAVVPDTSLDERTELFKQGWDLFLDRWLLGAGPGTFPEATGFLSTMGEFRPAHNSYMEIVCEQGVIGMIPFVILAWVVALTLWRAYHAATDEVSRSRVQGVSFGLVAVVLMAGTLGLLTFSMAFLALGLALAVAAQAQGTYVRNP
jgi:O-antigen ligase